MIESNLMEIICQRIGWAATNALALHYAEQRVYVPLLADPQHHLSKRLGERAFIALVELYGGNTIPIPACSDAQRIGMTRAAIRLRKADFSAWNIGRFLGVSERQVRNLVNDAAPIGEDEHVPRLPASVRRLVTGRIE
ncbi:MAG: hypothetical protein Q8O38_10720 [Sulfurimicrobium sp.]|nr:hypothetical protein [Sulfurimicrobium sp.]